MIGVTRCGRSIRKSAEPNNRALKRRAPARLCKQFTSPRRLAGAIRVALESTDVRFGSMLLKKALVIIGES